MARDALLLALCPIQGLSIPLASVSHLCTDAHLSHPLTHLAVNPTSSLGFSLRILSSLQHILPPCGLLSMKPSWTHTPPDRVWNFHGCCFSLQPWLLWNCHCLVMNPSSQLTGTLRGAGPTADSLPTMSPAPIRCAELHGGMKEGLPLDIPS